MMPEPARQPQPTAVDGLGLEERQAFTVGALSAILAICVLLANLWRLPGPLARIPAPVVAIAGLALIIGAALAAATIGVHRSRLPLRETPPARRRALRALAGLAALSLALGMSACFLTRAELQPASVRLLLYINVAVLGAALLRLALPTVHLGVVIGLGIIAPAVMWKLMSFASALSVSPFALGWSEASRYYYASLFHSNAIYGVRTAWPVLHPSRYLLQSIPFLAGNLPIAAHRLWQVGLWLGATALVATVLAWRWEGARSWRFVLLIGWGFLFLFQGPVYYHLALGVVPLLVWFRWDRPWRNLALVLIGSVWAGLSRMNWYPVPALLAAALLALESPTGEGHNWTVRGWRWPLAWILSGSLLASLSSAAYAQLSGNSLSQFGSSLTSDLLWYRLMPNATYPMGILPGIGIAVLPPALLIGCSLRQPVARDPLRLGLLIGVLAVLLLGGLVVSVKIGGGGDLHNLDAFLLLLLVVCGGLWAGWGRVRSEVRWFVVGLVVVVPSGFAILSGQPREAGNALAQRAALVTLRQRVEAADGPVLFLTQRQLLTFGEIQVPLVEDYEKVHLMEMAMARNPAYLAQFRDELAAHRFAVVVSDSLNTGRQGSQHAFGEENDAWLDAVVTPLLAHYRVEAQLPEAGVWLLVPRDP